MTGAFLIDVDEVCVNWLPGFRVHMQRLGVEEKPTLEHEWSLTKRYPALNEKDMEEEIKNFGHTVAFRDLPLMPGVPEGLAAIKKKFSKSLLIAVSACGTDTTIVEHRRHQLKYLPFDSILTVPLGSSKHSIYSQFKQAVVIDDNLDHIKSALRCGHLAVIYDQPWNRNTVGMKVTSEQVVRLFDWKNVWETL